MEPLAGGVRMLESTPPAAPLGGGFPPVLSCSELFLLGLVFFLSVGMKIQKRAPTLAVLVTKCTCLLEARTWSFSR